ncbi:uncharacterized protein K460DRAFT_279172 [Cucurbitaria berberidis CBS 394.84]|uniref:Uncharacterized protein n=1 Tax=Cucurbitaria berberidis CBS 394.84 TaxID=1168544 RepID=A0A9P4GNJ2_9PLEO|nr:uncharacterized protein K460DRAFT_279172 [Cucurbitaria berberidis CBS 394.84]KAF1848835.1 hypothetical protein K460DRAFT_279172 [Cucurbitaria berberidis CBS 394.84]
MIHHLSSSHGVPLPAAQQLLAESPSSSSTPATPEGAPCTETAVPRGPTQAPIDDFASLLDPSPPVPLPFASPQPLPTPILDDRPHFDLNFADSLLPSTNFSLPTPTVIKTAHNLRLPSFDVLGIAAPHPDRIAFRSNHPFSPLGAGPLSKPEDPLHALSPPLDLHHQADGAYGTHTKSPQVARAQVGHLVPTYTPPWEPGMFNWGSFVNVRTAGLGSPPSSDPGVSPNLTTTASATSPGQAPIVVPTYADLSDAMRMTVWVEDVKNMITTESGCSSLDSVKILSHALPCPSLTGHLFGQIIANIHDSTTTHTLWINVFHAVPGRYTLSDLPKSPPSTPGPAVGGDSYFTSKVFDSAVAIPDYQLDSKLLPPSPRPVVPPGSINVSVVERYIPPTNTNEFAELFSFRGRSLLYDRLVELSFDDGVLLFIYPTRTGGRTFMQQYLGPILDPLLRTVTVVHDLHSELGRSLGQMSSVNYLDEYDQLEAHVRKFCQALGERQGHGAKKANYEVIHAAKEEMVLERSSWADDMWVKQEKPRVREVISKYFRKSNKLHTGELTGANLIQEVLDGVSKREYEDGSPRKGVELGVFIVKKTGSV